MCNPNHAAAANAKASPPSSDTLSKLETAATTNNGAALKLISKSELAAHTSPSSAWVALHESSSSSRTTSSNIDTTTTTNSTTPTRRHIVLDITSFASTHPGGDLILLASGKDATVLFESYHPRGVPPSLIKKLTIGVMEPNSFTSFYSWHSEFYSVLKQRVIQRLESRKLQRRGSIEIWIKAAFLLVGFWYSLYKMYTTSSASSYTSFLIAAAWSISMGTFAALIGTNIQHDGNHGAFSNTKLINKLAGWTMDMIGASAYTWELQHMLGHHPYTNLLDVVEEERKGRDVDCKIEEKDQESDPDVFSSFPLMRMHPAHNPSWYHRYQHIYAPLLFGAMTLAKVFQQDFEVFFHKRLYHIDANVRYGSMNNVLRFWSMKFISMIYMVGLPIYFHGIGRGLALFAIGHFACGELLATMFIVNHVIEGVSYAKKDTKGQATTDEVDDAVNTKVGRPTKIVGDTPMDKTRQLANERIKNSSGNDKNTAAVVPAVPFNDWAAVQCQTSVNWAPGSWFWNHFSGGLSHQIEHHLFPSLCHTNYAYIHDVVEKTCEEYGVPYQSEPSLWVAYGKMLRHLKCLGTTKYD